MCADIVTIISIKMICVSKGKKIHFPFLMHTTEMASVNSIAKY